MAVGAGRIGGISGGGLEDGRTGPGHAAWFFFVLNVFKLPWSYGLGLITSESLNISLILAPWAVVGALAGRRLLTYFNQHLFEQVALALALAAGLRLLVG